MHHIFLRCGLRAFFFKCLAHSLVGERVDVGQFDHALRQQAQRPAGAFVGRRRAGQRDQVGLLRTIKLSLVEARSRAVGAQGRLQALLDKALTQSLDGGDTRVNGVRDARVRPAGPPSASSALSSIWACLRQRTSALPRDSKRSSSSRSSAVSVTRYFLGMAGLLPAAAPTTNKTLNPSLQL